MMQRRRMKSSGEAEDEEEVEVLRGGETKALEDAKPEGQEATEAQGSRQRSEEFLRTKTPSKALEVVKTPRGAGRGDTPKEPLEEWKTPKEGDKKGPTSPTPGQEGEDTTKATPRMSTGMDAQAEQALQVSPQWPGGPQTDPRSLKPGGSQAQTDPRSLRPGGSHTQARSTKSVPSDEPLFNTEQLRRYEELRRQAPMLNPGRGEEETLQGMRPEALKEEEMKILRAREAELLREREELKEEARMLRLMLAQRESARREEEDRKGLMNPPGLQDEEYRTPDEEKDPARRLFFEEAVRPPKPEEAERPPRPDEVVQARPWEAGISPRPDEVAQARPWEAGRSPRPDEVTQAQAQQGSMPTRREPGAEEPPGTLHLMAMMMQSMQEMQRKINSKEGGKEEGGGEVEFVRSHPEVPKLQDWNPSTGPIDLNDWLALIEPIMADLTATSGEWWEKLLKECRQWYQDHMALSPLDRLAHEPTPSKELQQPRWTRLERRASTLLMMSIPEAQKEELVSTKGITAMKILCHLFTTFQPGGLAEKEVILRSLESPAEAATVADAVSALRKWMRWRRRAMELQVSEPDPFLLLKGLGRIVKKPLEGNRELNFRVSLARSTLQVDSTPTRDTVGKFATHLLAEMEQIAHLDSNKKSTTKEAAKAAQPDAKLKKIEENSGEGKGWRPEKGNTPCKFFLTDEGCRKGQQCAWKHQVEGNTRRCWACGATDHYANKCPRPKKEGSSEEGWKKGAKGEGKSLQKATKEKMNLHRQQRDLPTRCQRMARMKMIARQ